MSTSSEDSHDLESPGIWEFRKRIARKRWVVWVRENTAQETANQISELAVWDTVVIFSYNNCKS